MNIGHYMKREASGLAVSTLELVGAEEDAGHRVYIKEPGDEKLIYGDGAMVPDIELVHSQLPQRSYHNRIPKGMWCHGEPISSVGNGVSMRAVADLMPLLDFMICMRQEEWRIWSSMKKTYVVPKGIDLDTFKPIAIEAKDKLAGEPAVLYVEHWRGSRNPLYLCVAMEQVWRQFPKARLHLVNCTDQRMLDTFRSLIGAAKWSTFVRTIDGKVDDVNRLYNRADIVVSCLFPLYARGIEAFGAGKAFIGAGYTDPEYPWHCDLHPDSMAEAIIACWSDYDRINYRQWAERKHDVHEMARQAVDIYRRYL